MNAAPHSSFPVKLGLLLVVLPLALAGAGAWQFLRAGESAAVLRTLDKSIAAIMAIQEQSGDPDTILPSRDGKNHSASGLLRLNKELRVKVLNNTWRQRVLCGPLAVGTVVFGLAGAGMGAFGLYMVRRAGRKALLSREALLREFQTGSLKLPWILGAIGLFIALGVASGGAFELVDLICGGVRGRDAGKVIVLVAFAIGGLLYCSGKLVRNMYRTSKAVFEREPLRLMGKRIAREDAPLVWDFVESVAGRAGAAMPDTIILGLSEGFFVTEHPVELISGEFVPPGRVLYLPLPYMAYMTRPEIAAVIGHELGHFTGADTEYSLRFAPIYATAVNNLRAVSAAAETESDLMALIAKPALLFGLYYLDSFDLAVQHWSREREFAADAVGARIAGNEALALALLRISVLAPHVHQALGECWAQGDVQDGGVRNRVRELVRTHGLGDPVEHLEEAQTHPTDSHPATSLRLAAVNVSVTPELLKKVRATHESTSLRDLGLEDDVVPEAGGRLRAGAGAGLSEALEAEFSKAAKASAYSREADVHAIAAQGTEYIVFREDTRPRQIAIIILTLASLTVAVIGFREGLHDLTAGSGIATVLGGWYVIRLRSRNRRPFLTASAEGFSAGAMDREIPWNKVWDYGITTNTTNGFRTSVEIVVDLDESFTPPAAGGDRRVRFKARQHRLYIAVQGIAPPYGIEGFAEAFHVHWQGGLAREQLRMPG